MDALRQKLRPANISQRKSLLRAIPRSARLSIKSSGLAGSQPVVLRAVRNEKTLSGNGSTNCSIDDWNDSRTKRESQGCECFQKVQSYQPVNYDVELTWARKFPWYSKVYASCYWNFLRVVQPVSKAGRREIPRSPKDWNYSEKDSWERVSLVSVIVPANFEIEDQTCL